jgi:transposase InsO family protein
MCRLLGVSPAGYYAWRQRGPSARQLADEVLMAHVRVAHAASDQRYGAPRVLGELQEQGIRTSQKRVGRLMRTAGLVARPRRRPYVVTTDSAHAEPIAPNLLAREFAVATSPADLNRVWVSDITYVPTQEGTLYLATVLDLGSRACIGWAMQDTLKETLTLDALDLALWTRRPAPGLIHHSDRGVHYASLTYRMRLAAQGIRQSMSRRGDCWDNAVAESFFATLEWELFMRHTWRTRAEARQAIFEYITTWYNPKRRHSRLGYLSPLEFERQLSHAA